MSSSPLKARCKFQVLGKRLNTSGTSAATSVATSCAPERDASALLMNASTERRPVALQRSIKLPSLAEKAN